MKEKITASQGGKGESEKANFRKKLYLHKGSPLFRPEGRDGP